MMPFFCWLYVCVCQKCVWFSYALKQLQHTNQKRSGTHALSKRKCAGPPWRGNTPQQSWKESQSFWPTRIQAPTEQCETPKRPCGTRAKGLLRGDALTGPRLQDDSGTGDPRKTRDTRETLGRHSGDTRETLGRHSGDTLETLCPFGFGDERPQGDSGEAMAAETPQGPRTPPKNWERDPPRPH